MKGINTFTLKMIAVISMIIDHAGKTFFPQCIIFPILGRIAFPIFAYTLVEGFFYTRNVKKYLVRLGFFMLLSEIPFDLRRTGKLLEFGHQNIFFTLFLGLLTLALIVKTTSLSKQFLIAAISLFLSRLLYVDYGSMGIMMILLFYYFRDKKKEQFLSIGLLNMLMAGTLQMFSMIAFVPIALHNGKQGPKVKWFFYAFYPAHLLVIYLIKSIS